jgi:hypothetical protein
LGAAIEPLDGRALTHGVDARAGEGAGSSAVFLHRVTMDWFSTSLFLAVFKVVLVEEYGKRNGGCCGFAGRTE